MLQLAAARQSRERQQGADCSQGYMSIEYAGILFDGPRTFVCYFKYEAGSRLQVIAGFTAPMMALEIAPLTNLLRFYCGTTSATAPIVPGNDYQAVVSYDGTTAVCYLNGSEAARFTVAGYAVTNVFRIGNPSYPPTGPVYSSSHYNYALSAQEVATLYNNGDPAGYVLPLTIKQSGCVAEYLPQNLVPAGPGERAPVGITGNGSYTWTGVDDTAYSIRINTSRNPVLGQWYLIKGTISNYEAGTPYISADTGYTEFALPRGNDEFSVFAQCRSIGPSSYFFTFRGGNRNTDRRLTITIESIEPINNIASTWLDSANQLPLNDEYLPPLLETAGGYDLTANGTPEIVYKPE